MLIKRYVLVLSFMCFSSLSFSAALTESPVPAEAIANQLHADSPVREREIEKEANAIQSIKQAKSVLKDILINLEHCGSGSCSDRERLTVCDYIGLLDIRLRGKIIGDQVYPDKDASGSSALKISVADLALFKRIGDSCKLTYYQYWNYPLFTHVNFRPTAKDKAFIYHQLGIAQYLKKSD